MTKILTQPQARKVLVKHFQVDDSDIENFDEQFETLIDGLDRMGIAVTEQELKKWESFTQEESLTMRTGLLYMDLVGWDDVESCPIDSSRLIHLDNRAFWAKTNN